MFDFMFFAQACKKIYIKSKYLRVKGREEEDAQEILASSVCDNPKSVESDVGLISWITSIVSSLKKMQFRARDDVKTDFKRENVPCFVLDIK